MPRYSRVSLLLGLLLLTGVVRADIKIGVIASSTGPTAVVGIPQKNTVALLPSEIAGQKIEYIVLQCGDRRKKVADGVSS
jgi:branched-chain amino acid transport system substrate-binding protein